MTTRTVVLCATACLLSAMVSAFATTTEPKLDTDKGWQPDNGNGSTITIDVWLDSLNEDQKRLVKAALAQWQGWKTADGSLSDDNYKDPETGETPKNRDVMSEEALQDGASGRNLSDTDKEGMDDLYDGKQFVFNFVDNENDADLTIEIDSGRNFEEDGALGTWQGTSSGITSGNIKIPGDLGEVTTGVSREWYYVTDSDGDGKITNADKDATGNAISEYKHTVTENGSTQWWYTHTDFYSLVKHEIGHTLGFGHSKLVPEPATVVLMGMGLIGYAVRQRRAMRR